MILSEIILTPSSHDQAMLVHRYKRIHHRLNDLPCPCFRARIHLGTSLLASLHHTIASFSATAFWPFIVALVGCYSWLSQFVGRNIVCSVPFSFHFCVIADLVAFRDSNHGLVARGQCRIRSPDIVNSMDDTLDDFPCRSRLPQLQDICSGVSE